MSGCTEPVLTACHAWPIVSASPVSTACVLETLNIEQKTVPNLYTLLLRRSAVHAFLQW